MKTIDRLRQLTQLLDDMNASLEIILKGQDKLNSELIERLFSVLNDTQKKEFITNLRIIMDDADKDIEEL
jgi:hypothetical protein